MAAEQVKSLSITNLDTTPIIPNTAAQGAAGRIIYVDDYVTCAATPLQSTKSVYRLVRFPTRRSRSRCSSAPRPRSTPARTRWCSTSTSHGRTTSGICRA
jgi:hypothetical protein